MKKTALVLYDYDALNDDELTVRENDTVEVLEDAGDDDWWKCKIVGSNLEGLVPANYLELKESSADHAASQDVERLRQEKEERQRIAEAEAEERQLKEEEQRREEERRKEMEREAEMKRRKSIHTEEHLRKQKEKTDQSVKK